MNSYFIIIHTIQQNQKRWNQMGSKLADNIGKITGGIIIVVIGLLFLLQKVGYVAEAMIYWPVLVIIIGLGIIVKYSVS